MHTWDKKNVEISIAFNDPRIKNAFASLGNFSFVFLFCPGLYEKVAVFQVRPAISWFNELCYFFGIYIYKLSMHSFPLKKHFRTLFIKKKYPVRRLLEWNVDIYLEKSPFDVFCEGGSTVKTSNGDPGKRNNRPRKKYSEKRRAQFGRTPGLRPFFYAGYLFLEVANIFLFAFKLVFAP